MAPKVAILGCGPSGMVAAHAAIMAGCQVVIYSWKQKSNMYGAQYLHSPIPFVSSPSPVRVNYQLRGTAEEYRAKVYGKKDVEVSPVSLREFHYAWDIRDTYDKLWYLYHDLIEPVNEIGYHWVQDLAMRENWHRIYSTIPAPAICAAPSWHHFNSTVIWANGDAPDRGHLAPRGWYTREPNSIICDGTNDNYWYRVSNVYDNVTMEWPSTYKPDGSVYVTQVRKPISHSCDCFAPLGDRFARLGRYGAWTKSILVHEVFTEVNNDLMSVV